MEANDLRAAHRSFADFFDGAREIFVRVPRAFHLHESNGEFVGHEF
jgi:hypothetical protein